mmetsp:Transcript_30526/g.65352  ORF Transcript_30526/g.65352 Transcript_30526/m.65352 type:complete len:305 (+) Transcript_30526:1073-1987(+)
MGSADPRRGPQDQGSHHERCQVRIQPAEREEVVHHGNAAAEPRGRAVLPPQIPGAGPVRLLLLQEKGLRLQVAALAIRPQAESLRGLRVPEPLPLFVLQPNHLEPHHAVRVPRGGQAGRDRVEEGAERDPAAANQEGKGGRCEASRAENRLPRTQARRGGEGLLRESVQGDSGEVRRLREEGDALAQLRAHLRAAVAAEAGGEPPAPRGRPVAAQGRPRGHLRDLPRDRRRRCRHGGLRAPLPQDVHPPVRAGAAPGGEAQVPGVPHQHDHRLGGGDSEGKARRCRGFDGSGWGARCGGDRAAA